MTIDQIASEVEQKILDLYWSACDAEKRAVLPSDLTSMGWVQELLDEQFEIALNIEGEVEGWDLAREKY